MVHECQHMKNRENNCRKDFLKDCLKPSVSIGTKITLKRILSNCNIKVSLKPYLTLGHIFAKPKDPTSKNQKTHAVYSMPCMQQL